MGIDKHGDKISKMENLKSNKNKSLKNEYSEEQKSITAKIEKKKRKHSAKNDADLICPDKSERGGKKKKKDHMWIAEASRQIKEESPTVACEVHHISGVDVDSSKGMKGENSVEGKGEKKKIRISKKKKEKKKPSGDEVDEIDRLAVGGKEDSEKPKHKSEKGAKKKRKDHKSLEGVSVQIKEESQTVPCEVYYISGVNVDSSKGMKKWINDYHQNRPGLKILQQRIDDFITSHEEKEEQAKRERDVLAAEGGWTVVEHHKGRKKTVDAESGTTVVSVAGAAVADKMGKKKSKDVRVDFYRFQKREAQRNEIMLLQSKFEQDKKRIQQLRAARKFRPY